MSKIFLLLLLLSGCSMVHDRGISQRLNHWVGSSDSFLVENWGEPSVTEVDSNTKLYTYVLYSKQGPNSPYPGQFAYNGDSETGWSPYPDSLYYCRITFVIQYQTVAAYNFNGDYCLSNILPSED
ncbi:MAG: hypothetical protein IJ689_00610 [Alphaproteobacteria bacterium]|nr:hypothetical protein [Alphaproteobacteria bacterium]